MTEEFTPEEIAILSRYVTNPTGDTFCVNIPGLAGPIYARYSRAITGLRRTLLKEFIKDGELNVSRTQELIERILNEYGDDSVGELEGAHLALEQVSNLLTKIVEDCRIGGSPIEQSTRYVFYDQQDANGRYKYYRGAEILQSAVGPEYEQTLDFIFHTYASAIQPLSDYFRKLKPMEEAEYNLRGAGAEKYSAMDTEALQKQFRVTYNADLRTKACDILRNLLPAATLTNVGLYGNGRFYQNLLSRLYSSTIPEANRRAEAAHHELNQIIPKFVKRARRDDYVVQTEARMKQLAGELLGGVVPEAEQEACVLAPAPQNPRDLLDHTLAAALYPCSKHPFRLLLQVVRHLSYDMRSDLLDTYAGRRAARRDRPGRAFEAGYPLTFDIQADFGAYRDLQRHRMVTQQRQLLHPGLGYEPAEEIDAIGFRDRVVECFVKSAALHSKMSRELSPELAQYAVLFGYRIRWMMGMNLREAMHLIELRTTPQGHPSYRRIAQQMMDALRNAHPELASTIRFADYNEYYWSRAESEARQRRKEREIDERYK